MALISILLPSRQPQDMLDLCLRSIKENSSTSPEVCLVRDDPSREGKWYDRSNDGWNEAAAKATGEWLFVGHDDFYFMPDWDIRLLHWAQIMPNVIFQPWAIQPYKADPFLYFDVGNRPDNFQEHVARTFAITERKNTMLYHPFAICQLIKREEFEHTDGFHREGLTFSQLDMQMQLKKLFNKKWAIAQDSFVYHLKHTFANFSDEYCREQRKIFEAKWGKTFEEAEKSLNL